MAKKTNKLDAKLGSWADQANLSRISPTSKRETYSIERSLIERISHVSAENNLTPKQLVGQLLTWSLDQVETGKHTLNAPNSKKPAQ
ncbi:MAG: hypothetical protein ACPG8W_13220 [Candidatus Promineifilaceae bacterium]